jgi:5-carboxymethyl-2-hydroxymuconate isomerase
MPHIIVEYSSNLASEVAIPELIGRLHQTVVECGLFDPSAVRTRAAPRDIYRIADGAPPNIFLHIVARIRAGRSLADRQSFGKSLLHSAREAIAALPPATPIALTVEVQEIDPETLFRHITIK